MARPRSALVVDGAGTLGTRDMIKDFEKAMDARVVLVGDADGRTGSVSSFATVARREAITALEQAREKEIEFWGKVIDQNNEPVTGMAVTATITTLQIPPSGFQATADDDLLGKYGSQWHLLHQRATRAGVHH